MKSLIKPLIVLNLIYAILGCASMAPIKANPELNETNSAIVHVYRPKSDWQAPLVEFRVFVDDKYIGPVEHSKSISWFLEQGQHKVMVRPYSFGSIPDGKPNEIELDLEVGKEYYLRFSQHADLLFKTGSSIGVSGHTKLLQVSRENWNSRR